jgi:Xaa-Pro aminopeptidase
MGMDIHEEEPNFYEPFQKGMVVTIEPGVYIPLNSKNVPDKFKGIGIRIEDNVLITHDGHDVITKDTPKTIDQIEGIMKN